MVITYSEIQEYNKLIDEIVFLAKLKKEHGSKSAEKYLTKVRNTLEILKTESTLLDVDAFEHIQTRFLPHLDNSSYSASRRCSIIGHA